LQENKQIIKKKNHKIETKKNLLINDSQREKMIIKKENSEI